MLLLVVMGFLVLPIIGVMIWQILSYQRRLFRASARRERLLIGLSTFFVVTIVFALSVLLVFVISSVDANGRAPAQSVGIDGSTLSITGVRGKTATFTVTGNSVNGWVATPDGLTLELPGYDDVMVVAPDAASWGDTITLNQYDSDDFSIVAAYRVPDVAAPEEQIVTGHLVGEVRWPKHRGGHFENVATNLDIAVTLDLVSAEHYAPPATPHGVWPFGLNGWVTAAILLGALGGLVVSVKQGRWAVGLDSVIVDPTTGTSVLSSEPAHGKSAADALREVPPDVSSAADHLMDMLKRTDIKSDHAASEQVIAALVELGPAALDRIVPRFIHTFDSTLKTLLLSAIRRIFTASVPVELRIECLKHHVPPVHARLKDELVEVGPRVVEPLMCALHDENVTLRRSAAEVLGRIGDPRAVAALSELSNDPQRTVRKAATAAIANIDGRLLDARRVAQRPGGQ